MCGLLGCAQGELLVGELRILPIGADLALDRVSVDMKREVLFKGVPQVFLVAGRFSGTVVAGDDDQ